MNSDHKTVHTAAMAQEMAWLAKSVAFRVASSFGENVEGEFPEPPELNPESSLAQLHRKHSFGMAERLLLALSLAPHISPNILEVLTIRDPRTNNVSSSYGGLIRPMTNVFLPTGDTFLFVMAGLNIPDRMQYFRLFDSDHWLHREGILSIDEPPAAEPAWSMQLGLTKETLDLCLYGKASIPRFSSSFPAHLTSTKFEWDDVVINPKTQKQIAEIELWMRRKDELMEDWGMKRLLSPGYRVLFHGLPGTGKTLMANLLGKSSGKLVFRIDLSQLVSKYIGETEKNLARIFDRAENKDWILFFDEADAVFGKRTNVKDAHDRFANQEVSYLLQRIEGFNGLVILASNLKDNIDSAFMRRMQTVVYFPMPEVNERKTLWESSFPEKAKLHESLSIERLAEKYEISGGSIINVVRYCSLQALDRGDHTIYPDDLMEGLSREYQKLGRVIR